MPKPNAKKRRVNRVKGFASRGRGKKWILVSLVVLLLIPAIQVAVVRFINPPRTLPMLIEQSGAMFSKGPKAPLCYHWIDLPQIPKMFLEHLWISEDQRFFQHEGFDWKRFTCFAWACPLRSWCVATRTANRNRSTLQNLTTDCPDRSKFSASTNRLGDLCKKTRNSPIRAIGVIRGSPDP